MSTDVSRAPMEYRGPDVSGPGHLGGSPSSHSSRAGQPLGDGDYRDIQGLVRFGYAHLKAARFHLLTIADPASARAWLSRAPVTSAVKATKPDTALNVAFTHEGLSALGGGASLLAQFPYEFISGMTESSRARRLGDVGANDPRWWQWGGDAKRPHVLVMVYALTDDRLSDWEKTLADANWQSGFASLASLSTKDIGDIEPFGFNDGLSQPVLDWNRARVEKLHYTTEYTNVSALGDVLLGYPNEYGKYTDRPLVDPPDDPSGLLPPAEDAPEKRDVGRNGTYLVLRDLVQDAPAFWRFVNDQAALEHKDVDATAAATVGRTPFDIPTNADANYVPHAKPAYAKPPGTPLVPLSAEAISGVGADAEDIRQNQFTFHNDVNGEACPYGAHIRRANPRNADLPQETRGLFATFLRTLGFGRENPHEDLIASTRFHRILRRGREYVFETNEGGTRSVQRGLRFVCLNANISRQFEFIQTSWLASPKFEGLDESDPLVGNRASLMTGRATDGFTRPHLNGVCGRSGPLPQFVRVVGGAYFFLPGIGALRFLSTNPVSS